MSSDTIARIREELAGTDAAGCLLSTPGQHFLRVGLCLGDGRLAFNGADCGRLCAHR